jgi:galacturan 1,4-alpha-galacturonidase
MVSILFISSALGLLAILSSVQAKTCTVSTSDYAATSIANAFNATHNAQSLILVTGLKDANVQFYGTLNLPAYNTKFEGSTTFFIHWEGAGIGAINGLVRCQE